MMEYRHCVCVPPGTHHPKCGWTDRGKDITKRFNSKQRHSSVRYMKNKQSEFSQDG